MSTERLSLDGVSPVRAVAAAVMCLLVASFVVFLDETITPALAAIYVMLPLYLAVNAVDRVREHPAFNLASTVWTALTFLLLYLGPVERNAFALVLAALAGLAVPVEWYNYRHGTSHLRIDW